MRTAGLFVLLSGCALSVGAQSSPPESKPSETPERNAQGPATARETQATEVLPEGKIAPGTAIELLIVEPAEKSDFSQLPFRTGTVEMYKKLTKEFEKQGRFRMVESAKDAQVVFFVLRFWKASYPHTLNYFALALTVDEYRKHVQWLNGFRGIAHVEDMLPAALWGTGRDYNMAKHWTVGLATAGLVNLGRPNPVDLVKQFHHDIL